MKRCVLFSMTARLLIALGVGIVLWAPTALPADRPDVLWETTVLPLRPAPEETSARGRFTFVNNGPRAVTIEGIKTSCGCMAAEAASAPGDGRPSGGDVPSQVPVRIQYTTIETFSEGLRRDFWGVFSDSKRDRGTCGGEKPCPMIAGDHAKT